MTDTVTRLMELVDGYANTKQAAAWSEKDPLQLKPEEIRKMWTDAFDIRQALEAELTRLFTPLSDEQIERMSSVEPGEPDDWYHLSPWEYKGELERARAAGIRTAEKAHGIGNI